MLLHKHEPAPENDGPPTDHVGLLRDPDVDPEFGGRMIGARFRAVMKMLVEIRRWVKSRCEAFRFETPSYAGNLAAGSTRALLFSDMTIQGHRMSAGTYICNRPGVYHISGMYAAETVTAGTVRDPRLALYRNDIWYSWLDLLTGTHDHWVLQGSDHVALKCGDELQLAWFFDVGGTLAVLNGSTGIGQSYGYFGGHWECDECLTVPDIATVDTLTTAFGATAS